MLNGGTNSYGYFTGESNTENDRPYNDVAFGVGLGEKYVTKRGFIGEMHVGIGRNLFDDNAPKVVVKGSVSLGYRF